MIILFRGLPGSGKSTCAREFISQHHDCVHIESDEWFVRDNKYIFNAQDLTLAHRYCALRCEALVRMGKNVVVANTFTNFRECVPYFVIAQKHDVKIDIVTCNGNYGSIHGVPPEKVEMMRARFQDELMIGEMGKRDLSCFFSDPYDAYNHF